MCAAFVFACYMYVFVGVLSVVYRIADYCRGVLIVVIFVVNL